MAFGFSRIIVFALAGHMALQGCAPSTAGACGLGWALPTNHFDGVDDHGYVAYWEKIGEVDCGDGLKLPLHINFNSGRDAGAPSPYLGQGWILPLLECKFIQESEDRFMMVQPDGLRNLFLRAEPNGTVLNGSAGWKGEIKGDTITAWAACGWKITFSHGRIAVMSTPEGKQLDWVYEGGHVTEVREGNAIRLRVEYGSDGCAEALLLPGSQSRIQIAQDKKPRIQAVGGQNIVAGVDSSLSMLKTPDGRTHEFTFTTDEKTLPKLTIKVQGTADRILIWDPSSKRIIRDGPCIYALSFPNGFEKSAAIDRWSELSGNEYWFYDAVDGSETTVGTSGEKIVRTWFVSGLLAGKTNKVERYLPAQVERRTVYKVAYNERGLPIREVDNGVETTYDYDATGKILAKRVGGKEVFSNEYDSMGRVAEETWEGGKKVHHLYYSSSNSSSQSEHEVELSKVDNLVAEARTVTVKGIVTEKTYYSKTGSLLARRDRNGGTTEFFKQGDNTNIYVNRVLVSKNVYVGNRKIKDISFASNGTVSSTVDYNYNDLGWITSEIVSCADGTKNSIKLKYDDLGRVVERASDLTGVWAYTYNHNERSQTFFPPSK